LTRNTLKPNREFNRRGTRRRIRLCGNFPDQVHHQHDEGWTEDMKKMISDRNVKTLELWFDDMEQESVVLKKSGKVER
jgi:hypothetical protein